MEFLRPDDLLELHAMLLQLYGGGAGLRDEGALISACLAAEHRAHYEGADAIACAATYAFHLTNAHAFIDGNKRVAAGACEVFLEINGYDVVASDDALYDRFMAMSAARMSREVFEAWLRGVVVARDREASLT